MRIALSAKNKAGFVDGSILRPNEHDPFFPSWQSGNGMVLSRPLHSISPNLCRGDAGREEHKFKIIDKK